MKKQCPKCGRSFIEGKYCSECGTKLVIQEESTNTNNSYDDVPYGYTRDFYGHIRPDPEYERQKEEELRESWKNRW
jgi:hypothetical protein